MSSWLSLSQTSGHALMFVGILKPNLVGYVGILNFLCIFLKKEKHTGLEKHEDEYMMRAFSFLVEIPYPKI